MAKHRLSKKTTDNKAAKTGLLIESLVACALPFDKMPFTNTRAV